MDLKTIKPKTQKINIRHPGTGEETGLVIEVGSNESDAVKRIQRRHLDKMIQNRGRKLTADQMEKQAVEVATAYVLGWEWTGDAAWDGKKLPFDAENVGLLLKEGWLRKQIEEVATDEAGFFQS